MVESGKNPRQKRIPGNAGKSGYDEHFGTSGRSVSSALLVAGAANLDRMMTLERIPEPGETILTLNYEEHPAGKGGN